MKGQSRPITIIVFISFVVSFVVANVFPSNSVFSFWSNDYAPYRHGWPLAYMTEVVDAKFDFHRLIYSPWPFLGHAPLTEIDPAFLLIDAATALCLIFLATRCVLSWERRSTMNLRHLLLLTVLFAVYLASNRAMGGYASSGVVAVLILGSGFLVILSIPLAIVSLLQMVRAFDSTGEKS